MLPSIKWRISCDDRILFLTFDDGPVPEVTPLVLDMLAANKAKGTFFCIGDNMKKYPEIFSRINNEGHAIGNHTFNHLNGWHTSKEAYLKNVEECESAIKSFSQVHFTSSLFRPPYGKLKFSQYAVLKKRNKIVMWDILTRDWEENRTPESCFTRVKTKAKPGSIIVFHDSIKAKSRMIPALEATLLHFNKLGYRFESLYKYV
ncbi:MAG: polysaccharide deacetylase family protein [Bacteroidota bacterium]